MHRPFVLALLTLPILLMIAAQERPGPPPQRSPLAAQRHRATGNALIDAQNPRAPFTLTVSTHDGRCGYVEGERIHFTLRTDRSCYITVLTVDAAGTVVVLLPNANTRRDYNSDHLLLNADAPITVPPIEPGVQRGFPVVPPHGESLVKVIGTLRPLDLENLRPQGKGLYEDLGAIGGSRMKSISDEFNRLKAIGQEPPIDDRPGRPAPVLVPDAYATAEFSVITGADEADLARRQAQRGGGDAWPPRDERPPAQPPPADGPGEEPPPFEPPPADEAPPPWEDPTTEPPPTGPPPSEQPPPPDEQRPPWPEDEPPPWPESPGETLPPLPDLPELPPIPPIPPLPPIPWPEAPDWPPPDAGAGNDDPLFGDDPNAAVLRQWFQLTQPFPAFKSLLVSSDDAATKSLSLAEPVEELVVFYEEGFAPPSTKGLEPAPLLEDARIVRVRPEGAKALDEKTLEERIADVAQQPGVVAVIPNREYRLFAAPDTHLMPAQWALRNRFAPGMDTNWHAVADRAARITPPLIGVCDQGLSLSDPRLRAMVWTNRREVEGNGVDDDGNGFVDDVHGFNFISRDTTLYGPMEQFNHGSYCSSLIAGRQTGHHHDVIGIAQRAAIMPVAVIGPNGRGSFDAMVAGLRYAARNGAKIINLSLGTEVLPFEVEQIRRVPIWAELQQRGVILVCAAGNDHLDTDARPHSPACVDAPNFITVLATDAAGRLGRDLAPDPFGNPCWEVFTNYGARAVDIGAPGSLIVGIPAADQIDISAGTSFSAPLVTGAVGLVWGAHPDWDYRTVIRAILETARPSPHLVGKCRTGGMLDVEAALDWRP